MKFGRKTQPKGYADGLDNYIKEGIPKKNFFKKWTWHLRWVGKFSKRLSQFIEYSIQTN